jgi:hypothetical protein
MHTTTLDSATINRNRNRSANLFTLAATGVCGLGLASTLVPAVEQAVTVVLLVLAAAGLSAWLVCRVARILRWRREDRADALVAAAWRASHPRPARTAAGVS